MIEFNQTTNIQRMKTCTKCGKQKAKTDFYKYQGDCKKCRDKVIAAYRKTDKGKAVFKLSEANRQKRDKQKVYARQCAARLERRMKRDGIKPKCEYPGCKCKGKPEKHHPDYSKPWFIKFFCRKHHRLVDNIKKLIDKSSLK